MVMGVPFVLQPAIAALVETLPVNFDYGVMLTANFPVNTHIISIDSLTVSLIPNTGVDPSPQSRLIGVPIITPSTTYPNILQGQVTAYFGTMIGGCVYQLACVVLLSDDATHPDIYCQLPCV